jgi:hypothetical protein
VLAAIARVTADLSIGAMASPQVVLEADPDRG